MKNPKKICMDRMLIGSAYLCSKIHSWGTRNFLHKLLWNYWSPSILSPGKTRYICTVGTHLNVSVIPESIVGEYVKKLSRSMPKQATSSQWFLSVFARVTVANIKCFYHFLLDLEFRRNSIKVVLIQSTVLDLKISSLGGIHVNCVSKIVVYKWRIVGLVVF